MFLYHCNIGKYFVGSLLPNFTKKAKLLNNWMQEHEVKFEDRRHVILSKAVELVTSLDEAESWDN